MKRRALISTKLLNKGPIKVLIGVFLLEYRLNAENIGENQSSIIHCVVSRRPVEGMDVAEADGQQEEEEQQVVSFEGEDLEVVDDGDDDARPPMEDDDDDDDGDGGGGDEDGDLADEFSGVQMEDDDGTPLVDDSVCTLVGHTDCVYAVAVRRDGGGSLRVLTGGGDDSAKLWRVELGGAAVAGGAGAGAVPPPPAAGAASADAAPAPTPSPTPLPPPVAPAAGAAAEEATSTAALDMTAESTAVATLGGHTDSVAAVGFSSDGTLCATGGLDGLVKVWDAADGSFKRTLEGPSDVDWLSWHSKGNVLLAGSSDGTVWMWLAATGACMQVFAGHEGAVTCGVFTPDGKGVVTGGADATVRVWAPKKGTCRHVFQGAQFHEAPITCLATHPHWEAGEENQLLVSGGEDGVAKLMHLGSKKVVASFGHSTGSNELTSGGGGGGGGAAESAVALSVEAVALCPVQPWAATAGIDGTCKVWDLQGARLRRTIRLEGSGAVTSVKWHPSSPCLLAGSADGKVRLWDARAGAEAPMRTFSGHGDMIESVAASFAVGGGPDLFVSASDDQTAKVFALPTPKF